MNYNLISISICLDGIKSCCFQFYLQVYYEKIYLCLYIMCRIKLNIMTNFSNLSTTHFIHLWAFITIFSIPTKDNANWEPFCIVNVCNENNIKSMLRGQITLSQRNLPTICTKLEDEEILLYVYKISTFDQLIFIVTIIRWHIKAWSLVKCFSLDDFVLNLLFCSWCWGDCLLIW